MVYTGKPSKGCGTCKSRRIKCDEKRPICGQCTKSGRECPGYPDEFDLMFRDENKALARKARKGSNRGEQSGRSSPTNTPGSAFERSPRTSPPLAESSKSPASAYISSGQLVPFSSPELLPGEIYFDPTIWNHQNTIPKHLAIAHEFEAIPFFFRNFVSLPQQADSMRGYLELLVPLYSTARPSSALHLATNAVALAASGASQNRPDLMGEAAAAYGKALRKLNEDLQDPAMAKSNENVLATLLFSLYETIMSTGDTISAWGNHVDGAVALTKLRGMEQFKDPVSHNVFRAVRTMMITSCVQRSKPVDSFPGINRWVASDLSEENAANRLTLICIDLPDIRARANTLINGPYHANFNTEAMQILALAQMVDENLQQWYETLPAEWQHQTIGIANEPIGNPATAEKWPGEQHVYYDVSLASIVNDYRVCRIFCQRVIMRCISWLSTNHAQDFSASYEHAILTIQRMVDEISACVPFHLTYELQPAAKKLGQAKEAAQASGAYSLVWSIYVAANAETVPQLQRDWLAGRLMLIGMMFGLSSEQVLVLAKRQVLTCGPMFP